MKPTFIDFCAGIGSGRLGLELSGFQCIAYSEINQDSIKTYEILHGSNEKNLGDLTKINIQQLPNFDLMIAGFPCQTFSIAGLRKGFDDERGQIIYNLVNILKAKQIKYFILENVKGLVNHNKGQTLKTILELLNNANYDVNYNVFNSLDFNIPHMRERIYFIGIRKDLSTYTNNFFFDNNIFDNYQKKFNNYLNIKNFLIDENNELNYKTINTFKNYLNNKYNCNKFNYDSLLKKDYLILDTRQSDLRLYKNKVPTLRAGRQGILYVKNGKLKSITGYESLLLQGFPKHYADKIKGKITNSKLLFQTGNAMTVNVIQYLGTTLLNFIK